MALIANWYAKVVVYVSPEFNLCLEGGIGLVSAFGLRSPFWGVLRNAFQLPAAGENG